MGVVIDFKPSDRPRDQLWMWAIRNIGDSEARAKLLCKDTSCGTLACVDCGSCGLKLLAGSAREDYECGQLLRDLVLKLEADMATGRWKP